MSVEASGRYYYAVILDRVRLFGGNWTFVFHSSSEQPLSAEAVLGGPRGGYHAFVDFIWAKREKRLARLRRGVDVTPLWGPGRLKGTNAFKGKAHLWFIYDMSFKELKRAPRLSAGPSITAGSAVAEPTRARL